MHFKSTLCATLLGISSITSLLLISQPVRAEGAYEGHIDGEFKGWEGETV